MFPSWHIALTAAVTAVVTVALGGVLVILRRVERPRSKAMMDALGIGLAAGLGVLLWRLGANISLLNDDPLPGVSPADVLSAPIAYVAAGVYRGIRGASQRLALLQALAALVALVVNIVTI